MGFEELQAEGIDIWCLMQDSPPFDCLVRGDLDAHGLHGLKHLFFV